MAHFAVRRLAGMVLVLFAVSVLVFLIFNVIPNSDPAQRMAGKNASPALVASIEEEWSFDRSLPAQYVRTMEKLFSGDLISYSDRQDVDERIVEGIPATLSLCVGAAILWLSLGIAFGYYSAIRKGGVADRGLTILAVLGISVPVFLLGNLLLYLLAFKVELFPGDGYVPLTEDPGEWLYHLILPWITLAVLQIGFYSRVLRANMLDAMDADYVRTARAKGLGEHQVRIRHVLRNSLIPIVTLFGLDFGAVLGGGAILTEKVFDIEGVGLYAADSIAAFDLPPVMAITMYGAFLVVFFNAMVDIAYAYLDPRVRLGSAAQ